MTTASELFALQRTDLALDSTVARLAEVEAQLGETEELIGARQRLDQCREEVREIQARKKELDFQAESCSWTELDLKWVDYLLVPGFVATLIGKRIETCMLDGPSLRHKGIDIWSRPILILGPADLTKLADSPEKSRG